MNNQEIASIRSVLPFALAAACEGESPQFGKTAFMKLTYLLQEVYDVPLGYRFTLYTYGPYCKEVLADLERAEINGWVDIDLIEDSTGFAVTPRSESLEVKWYDSVVDPYRNEIDGLVRNFGGFSARDLELRTTIMYLWKVMNVRSQDIPGEECVIEAVRQLKPQFSTAEIRAAADELTELSSK